MGEENTESDTSKVVAALLHAVTRFRAQKYVHLQRTKDNEIADGSVLNGCLYVNEFNLLPQIKECNKLQNATCSHGNVTAAKSGES